MLLLLLFYLWELPKKHTKRHLTLFKIILWLNIYPLLLLLSISFLTALVVVVLGIQRELCTFAHTYTLEYWVVVLLFRVFQFSKRNKNILVLAFNDFFVFFCSECCGVYFSLHFEKNSTCVLFPYLNEFVKCLKVEGGENKAEWVPTNTQ